MKRLLLVAALAAGAVAVASPAPAAERPRLAPCPGTVVWVNYGQPVGCDVIPPQVLHERYIPSTWTLAQAHTYCTGLGSVGAFTRYGNTANVCPDIDY